MTFDRHRDRTRDRLQDRLAAAATERFVGRAAELAVFADVLAEPAPAQVLWVCGLGGIGKTTLLRAWYRRARDAGRPTAWVDLRSIDATPESLAATVGGELAEGTGTPSQPPPALVPAGPAQAPAPAPVIFIDGLDAQRPLQGWLRRDYLPSLPGSALVVLASRQPPDPDWRADPGWSALLRVVRLRNLAATESRHYLTHRGVPSGRHATIIDVTRGHPLALSLLVEQALRDEQAPLVEQADLRPEAFSLTHPDVIESLVRRLVDELATEDQRRALEVCVHLRVTTEDRLAAALGRPEAAELFDWLRGLSFVDAGADGLRPHDLVRDVMEADLRWRNPERYRRLHSDVRRTIVQRLQRDEADPAGAFRDLLFLHRTSPVMQPLYHWQGLGQASTHLLSAGDVDVLAGATARFRGPRSAEILRYWAGRQPEAFSVFRDGYGVVVGCVCLLDLTAVADVDRRADPAIGAAETFMRTTAPVRPGEAAIHNRFAMSVLDSVLTRTPGVLELVSMLNTMRW